MRHIHSYIQSFHNFKTGIRAARRTGNHSHTDTITFLPSAVIYLCLSLLCQPAIHLLTPTHTHTSITASSCWPHINPPTSALTPLYPSSAHSSFLPSSSPSPAPLSLFSLSSFPPFSFPVISPSSLLYSLLLLLYVSSIPLHERVIVWPYWKRTGRQRRRRRDFKDSIEGWMSEGGEDEGRMTRWRK